jgi:hypothetical protein
MAGRKRAAARTPGSISTMKLERTTIFLPAAMLRNLDLLALKKGLPKGEIVRNVIAEHLRANHLEPDRMPVNIKIEHSYL